MVTAGLIEQHRTQTDVSGISITSQFFIFCLCPYPEQIEKRCFFPSYTNYAGTSLIMSKQRVRLLARLSLMDLSADLYHAVVNNDVEKLTSLLDNGANPNEFYQDMANISSKHILHICASKGHVNCARLLVDHGARILSRDNWRMTPLMYAAISNCHQIIEYFMSICPETAEAGDNFGKKPLHYALEYDSVDSVRVLLNHGADVNCITEHGLTPLMALCSTRDPEHRELLIELLLDAGAELELREFGSQRTALQYAAMKRNTKDVEALLHRGADPNTLDAVGKSPVTNLLFENIKSSQRGQDIYADVIAITLILLQSGADIDLNITNNSNPLFVASYLKSNQIVKFLLDNGADPDVKDLRGRSPLLVAINQKDIDTVRVLISGNCNLYLRGNSLTYSTDNDTILNDVDSFEMAVAFRQWEIVNLLVLAGYNLSHITYLADYGALDTSLHGFDEVPWFLSYLREIASQPMSLFLQTCLLIRRQLKTCIQDKAELLPLPVSLKQSVSLCNYDDYGVPKEERADLWLSIISEVERFIGVYKLYGVLCLMTAGMSLLYLPLNLTSKTHSYPISEFSLSSSEKKAGNTHVIIPRDNFSRGHSHLDHPETRGKIKHIAFLKTHKCGSTTLMNVLQRFGYVNNLTFVLPSDDTNIISQIDTLLNNSNFIPHPRNKKFDILCNHVIYDNVAFHTFLPSDTVYISIVRDPFEHFVSSFMYYRLKWHVPYLKLIPGNNPISTYLTRPLAYEPRHPGASFTNNRIAYDFGFPTEFILNPVDEKIKFYLNKILSEFHFVLITEYFDESIVLLRRSLNWTMKDILYFSKNRSTYNTTRILTELMQQDRLLHRKWAKLDYLLYEKFLQKFHRLVSLQDSSFKTEVDEFKQIRKSVINFCESKEFSPGSALNVYPGKTHGPFTVTVADCSLLQLEESEFTSALTHRQHPGYKYTPPHSNLPMKPPIILHYDINKMPRDRLSRHQLRKQSFVISNRRRIPQRNVIRNRPLRRY
ncbi:hypothetical protein FSP39_021368 [Pinctada imbricata]|uniref:Uncharacterized protein n=1 Tax=Pinctada imbricata TaxID=66713 RepID=A0AA88YBF1_PINIB|nr:hypothetical protein FSP39_021368 [Pinctada imbricata]